MFTVKEKYKFYDFVELVSALRDPENGCPWDKDQTHESLRKCFVEEAYEAVDAIDKKDSALLREELGDVLLQILMHAQIEKEQGTFDVDDVIDEVCQKMVVRHPHIFGDEVVQNADDVLNNWDTIKMETKGQKTHSQSVMDVPLALPALMRGHKIGKRAEKSGLIVRDIDKTSQALVASAQALVEKPAEEKEALVGEMLLHLLDFCRFFHLNAEECLTKASNSFINRFVTVESKVLEMGKSADDLTDEEKQTLWACTD